MSVVIQCSALGYIPQANHVAQYRKNLTAWVGESKRRMPEGIFYWAIADDRETALRQMKGQVTDYMTNISWLRAQAEDIWFEVKIEDVREGGFFWPPGTMVGQKYRLSDLKEGEWK